MSRAVGDAQSEALKQEFRRIRRRVVASIRRRVTPHFWETGYRTNATKDRSLFAPRRPLLGWFPKDEIELGGFVEESILGITEHGIAVDGHGGGLVTWGYGNFPLEDLIALDGWLAKNLGQVATCKSASAAALPAAA